MYNTRVRGIVKHLVLIDQLGKLCAAALLRSTVVLIPGLLDLNLVRNTGISFGIFANLDPAGLVKLKFAIIIITLLIYLYYKARLYYMTQTRANALELIIAGAVGNLLDRFLYGGVIDFLSIKLFGQHLFTCNFADIYLSIGVIMFLLSRSKPEVKQPESFKDILFREDDL